MVRSLTVGCLLLAEKHTPMVGDSGRLFDTFGERNGADRHKFMFGDIYGGIGHDAEQPFVDT